VKGGKKEMEKKRSIIFWMVFSLILIGFNAQAAMIDDSANGFNTYWGGMVVNSSPTSYGDVIGYPDFSLDRMTVTISNNTMTVNITGPYFYDYNHGVGLTGGYGPGDLYINPTGWIYSGAGPHFTGDTFTNAEGWEYVVHLDPATGLGAIYDLDWSSSISNPLVMTSAPNGYVYRADQAWKGGYGTELGTVTGSLDDSGITYAFAINNVGLGNEFGFHWTMKCGNDVIEGADPPAQAPEPGTLMLLGAGLVGLTGALRRRKKAGEN
jgi:hypothetical protein